MNIFMCNIGNSDLNVDGNTRAPFPPREKGEQLWNDYESHSFTLPLIQPALDYLTQRGKAIDQFILFDTDQEGMGSSDITKDTLWFGKIIERVLQEQDIRLIRRRTLCVNPARYDDAMDEFSQKLKDVHVADAHFYVLVSGGTPAVNFALLFQILARFGDRCTILYTPRDEATDELHIGKYLTHAFNSQAAMTLLERHDFAGASSLLPAADPALRALVRYASLRAAFDFASAQSAWDDALKAASGGLRQRLREMDATIRAFDPQDHATLLLELYQSARIAWNNGRYADFLGRLFRFREEVLRRMVEQGLGISTDMSKAARAETQTAFGQLLEQYPDLKEQLEDGKVDGQKLRYDNFSAEVLNACVKYLIKKGISINIDNQLKGIFTGVADILDKFKPLSDLRNQSIIAHGFSGVSERQIQLIYKSDPLEMMGQIMAKLRISVETHPFDTIAAIACDELRRAL